MAGKGRRRMISLVAGLAGLLLAGWLGLQYAIARNGPAVVDVVDRVTGSERQVALVERAAYGDDPRQTVAIYRSGAGQEPLPVILFVHGGSWNSGNPADYGFVARGLVPEGFVVVLAGYRLHPSVHFPAMLEDTAAAVAWTRENIARHGGDPDRIVLMGHSAGAYNVVMTALDRQWLGREGQPVNAVAGVIGLAGPYDFYPFDSDSTRASFGEAPDPAQTQPVNYARADAPPLLLLTGEADTTVKPRNTRALAQAMTQAGGAAQTGFYHGMDHADILLALASPWRRDRAVLDRITAFAREPSVPVQEEMR